MGQGALGFRRVVGGVLCRPPRVASPRSPGLVVTWGLCLSPRWALGGLSPWEGSSQALSQRWDPHRNPTLVLRGHDGLF